MYKVGLELELKPVAGVTRADILDSIRAKGIAINYEGYTHEVMSSWKAVSDASVSGGFEIVSPPLAGMPRIEREVKLICEAVKDLARVDRQCGFHLHVDVLNKYWAKRRVNVNYRAGKLKAIDSKPVRLFCAKLLKNYAYFQPVIDAIVAPSRRVLTGHAYNNPIQDEWANITDAQLKMYSEDKGMVAPPRGLDSSARYNVINFVSLASYGTVEFRQFQGTLNATKIVNWVKLMERFVARTADRKYKNQDCRNYPITVDGMCDFLGFGASDRHVRGWVRGRVAGNGFEAIAAPTVQVREPVYGTTAYEVELHMANDHRLYTRIRRYMRLCETRGYNLRTDQIRNMVLKWNIENDFILDDYNLKNRVNWENIKHRLETRVIL
jgi:hypothetical protein